MTTMTTLFRTLAVAAIAATLTGCLSAPKAVPPPSMADLLSQASQASTVGDKEKAITLWKQTGELYPTDKTPWVNITQAKYDAGKYSEAIINAQEILVRDPANTFAHSIIATSGLRLSTRSLSELTRNNNLSGTVRAESQDLAKLLRESLGEYALFTPPAKTPGAEEKPTKKSVVKKVIKQEAEKADPFSSFK
jgi:tetratricopeptide (TPR) repeat protein